MQSPLERLPGGDSRAASDFCGSQCPPCACVPGRISTGVYSCSKSQLPLLHTARGSRSAGQGAQRGLWEPLWPREALFEDAAPRRQHCSHGDALTFIPGFVSIPAVSVQFPCSCLAAAPPCGPGGFLTTALLTPLEKVKLSHFMFEASHNSFPFFPQPPAAEWGNAHS